MREKNWKIFGILTAVIAAVLAIIDWRMMLSFLLGSAAAVLTYFLTERFVNTALSLRSSGGTIGHFAVNYAIWAAVLTACALLPEYLNVLTCALGLMMIKISLIAGEAGRKKE